MQIILLYLSKRRTQRVIETEICQLFVSEIYSKFMSRGNV